MNISTKRILVSKLHPEITYEARSFSEGRRQALVLAVADYQFKLFDLIGECNSFLPLVEGETMSEVNKQKRLSLIDQIDELEKRSIHPAWIRQYVTKINGLEIDGVEATVETFISDAPSELFGELVTLVKSQAELTPEEKSN